MFVANLHPANPPPHPSQIYFHLDDQSEALRTALLSGPFFDVGRGGDEYTDTVVSRCVDDYVAARAGGRAWTRGWRRS